MQFALQLDANADSAEAVYLHTHLKFALPTDAGVSTFKVRLSPFGILTLTHFGLSSALQASKRMRHAQLLIAVMARTSCPSLPVSPTTTLVSGGHSLNFTEAAEAAPALIVASVMIDKRVKHLEIMR